MLLKCKNAVNIFYLVVFFECFDIVCSFLCYNGTVSNVQFGEDPLTRNYVFGIGSRFHARVRCSMTILCPENAVCFVRSWKARAKHAWIVQRGCYELKKEESLPSGIAFPFGSMACKRQRFGDAEYKVCFCQGDRCNGAQHGLASTGHYLFLVINLISYFTHDCN